MEYDSGIEKIKEWTTLDIIPSPAHIESYLPDGWKQLATIIEWYVQDLVALSFSRISIQKGLLRIEISATGEGKEALNKIISNALAVKSSLLCMVCGKRGFRRKEEEGWPSLCSKHYTQYVNYLDAESVR